METLEKYSPIITDENLTRNFEKETEMIQKSSGDFEEKEKKIIKKAEKTVADISSQFKNHEKEIGKELVEANVDLIEQMKKENILIQCPVCKKGNLAITYSKKTRRYFVACNAYPKCKTTFSLPPNGIIKKSGKDCEDCGFPMLIRLSKGKRPWIFCFNPGCVKNKDRIKKINKNN